MLHANAENGYAHSHTYEEKKTQPARQYVCQFGCLSMTRVAFGNFLIEIIEWNEKYILMTWGIRLLKYLGKLTILEPKIIRGFFKRTLRLVFSTYLIFLSIAKFVPQEIYIFFFTKKIMVQRSGSFKVKFKISELNQPIQNLKKCSEMSNSPIFVILGRQFIYPLYIRLFKEECVLYIILVHCIFYKYMTHFVINIFWLFWFRIICHGLMSPRPPQLWRVGFLCASSSSIPRGIKKNRFFLFSTHIKMCNQNEQTFFRHVYHLMAPQKIFLKICANEWNNLHIFVNSNGYETILLLFILLSSIWIVLFVQSYSIGVFLINHEEGIIFNVSSRTKKILWGASMHFLVKQSVQELSLSLLYVCMNVIPRDLWRCSWSSFEKKFSMKMSASNDLLGELFFRYWQLFFRLARKCMEALHNRILCVLCNFAHPYSYSRLSFPTSNIPPCYFWEFCYSRVTYLSC